ncbi:tetratricopeptide repeat protein [Vreelandella salicampi]|uniref:protein O-GlcNAc transferase n=1 Tax=Vreelandella salicampi TaxID=1449798 RepID=A0A7Z0LIV3_9GAMM|nr:tetratricopeptide repeat protein [Halomonas salicampi]NYS59718.1 tetratricopeptide repeat protein [Halomonas salicampi]
MSKQPAKSADKQLKDIKKMVARQPNNAQYRRTLGALLTDKGKLDEAKSELEEAIRLKSDDFEAYSVLGKVLYNMGDYNKAITCLEKSLAIKPGFHKSEHYLSYLLYNSNKPKEALAHIEEACKQQPRHPGYLVTHGNILEALHRYEEAAEQFKKSLAIESDKYYAWNNLGNIYKQLGKMEDALYYYSQAFKVNPQSDIAYSNKITTLHYIPSLSLEEITKECRAWDDYFNKSAPVRVEAQDKSADKKLRIGLISDGFRRHPVGYMITSVIEEIANYHYELFFYPTNYDYDSLTERLQKTATKWKEIKPLGVEQTENLIREDQIDILIDLAGHNSGNRMLAIAKEPAPIIMKWVGGLINTTGVKAIDYLISDHVETPSGVDDHYVENLIRLPDDYICYNPPGYAPNVAALPAAKNGYITFGCFNNPTKINPEIVAAWSDILLAVPNSRFFLKGMQFSSEELKKRVTKLFEECGVPEEQLIIEGPSAHKQLLESYHRVDIALDPWPYSGGLTTCEALLMGVPVITMPGPTFAGRHSASHLVNAGLGELVVDTWEEYRQRAIGLASDLESLSIIRKGLRQQLLDSPVCDATRFARHLNTALRAAWQRYCEGKRPAALAFDQDGEAYFDGDTQPVEVLCSEPVRHHKQKGFSWELLGKIIVIDNSCKLIREDRFNRLRQVNAFGFVAFDPASRVDNPAQFEGSDDVQVLPHAVLGDGQPATLHACLEPTFSSTLEPFPPEQQHGANPQGAKVLVKLPINTIALDSIDGLESLDWLILDELSEATVILENGEKALKETLVIQVRIAFQPTHQRQPNLAEIQHWMARHGFRFYRFNDQQHLSHLPKSVFAEKRQATELQSADAIFLPSHERMAELNDNQRTKLAFLLHTVYGIKDMAYELLAEVDEEKAEGYLIEERVIEATKEKQGSELAELPDEELTLNVTF